MISHWFVPDEKAAIRPERLSKSSLWHKITFLDEEESFSSGDVLLINFDRHSARQIKKNLYQFNFAPSSALRIIDCGNFIQKQPESIIPVLREIQAAGAMVILIGTPLSFMRYQVSGRRMVSIIRESNLDDDIHLRTEPPSPLIQYIGTQRHLISESHVNIEGHLRLSDLRDDISLAEPCIRDSDVMLFHCDSLCASESGYINGMSSSGLNVIEACQLFRYAGATQTLTSIGIYGYMPDQDTVGMTSNALAQMIWYFLEGSTLREDPSRSVLTQYIIQSKDQEHTLLFYKSEISGRWWIENKEGRKVPCSYHDYRKACEEDYSETVIRSLLG